MGNCVVNGVNESSSSKGKTAKLIVAGGDGLVRKIRVPAKVAEIMLENPGMVVCFSDQIKLTGKVVPLKADDEIEAGKFYMLFHVGKINRKVTEAEKETLDVVLGKRNVRRPSGNSQVSPTAITMDAEEEEEEEEVTVMLSRGRRWSPVLEPISEAC